MKGFLNRKVSLATSLLVILLMFVGIGAIITVRQGGIILYQDKATEPGSVFFVNSSTGSDASGCGRSTAYPCDTIDYAIGLTTASAGDVIYVMPGYVEDGDSTEIFDADVAGISIIGLGTGDLRPRLDFNYATDYVSIGAAGVTIKNIIFRPGVTSTTVGLNIEAAGDGAVIEGCEFAIGEAAGTDEFVSAITIAATANDVVIRNNEFRTAITDNGCVQAIYIGTGGACARTHITDNYMYGNWSTAAVVDSTTAQTEVYIADNDIKVKDGEPGIELTATTTGILARNTIESTGVTANVAIVAADCSWQGNLVVNADGEASTQIGENKAIGTIFYIPVTVAAGASVATGGLALTGAASGTLELIDVNILVGATALASANGTAALELYTDNTKGTDPFMHVIQTSLTANDNVSFGSLVTVLSGATLPNTTTRTVYGHSTILSSGKKIYVKADTQTFNAGGTFTINMLFRRLSENATIASR